jgi:3-dehydroquinate dehydratase
MTDIQFALGDRKIDIVTVRRRTEGSQKEDETEQRAPLIVQEARKEAVEL